MDTESDTVSGWFVLNAGLKVYGRCPSCHSPRISYHKCRKTGLKGISHLSHGLSPVCVDCGKGLPTQVKPEPKQIPKKIRRKRVY